MPFSPLQEVKTLFANLRPNVVITIVDLTQSKQIKNLVLPEGNHKTSDGVLKLPTHHTTY
jgi:hypothetical protein